MKILLIAGHGAGDSGATSTLGGVSYQEFNETRKMVSLLAKRLRWCAEVTTYDSGKNAYEDYKNGVLPSIAQFSRYDYVLEIHFNAYRQDQGDGEAKGVECYVTTSETAITVEEDICTKVAALGFPNRGVKRYNWAVISEAKRAGVSAALLEVCFIDDADDMNIYTRNKKAIAKAITDGIREGFGLSEQEMTVAEAKQIIKENAGLEDKTIEYLNSYIWRDDLLKKLAAAML